MILVANSAISLGVIQFLADRVDSSAQRFNALPDCFDAVLMTVSSSELSESESPYATSPMPLFMAVFLMCWFP
jgi:hypothetical protein